MQAAVVVPASVIVNLDEEEQKEPTIVATVEVEVRNDCSICFESLDNGDPKINVCDSHYFHVACIGRWARNSGIYPLCHRPIVRF